MNTKVLVIEDDQDLNQLLVDCLSSHFTVSSETQGEAGLKLAKKLAPEIILLDITLPNINGYEVCKHLKTELPETRVVFISGTNTPDAREAAYEVGGDDFIAKPFRMREVLSKIQLLERSLKFAQTLQDEILSVRSTTMNAISSAGDMGAVMAFARNVSKCRDTDALLKTLINSLSNSFGLDVSAQLRGYGIQKTLNSSGRSSPLEAEMLAAHVDDSEHIFHVGQRLVFNYPTTIVQIKSMPNNDDALVGRIRDNVAIIVELAETAFERITNNLLVNQQAQMSERAMLVAQETIAQLDAGFRKQSGQSLQIFEQLSDDLDDLLMFLALTEEQENRIKHIVTDASTKALEIYTTSKAMDQQFENLLQALKPIDPTKITRVQIAEPETRQLTDNDADSQDDDSIILF